MHFFRRDGHPRGGHPFTSLFALMGLMMLTLSCSKKNDEVTPSQNQAGFSMTVNGSNYVADMSYAVADVMGNWAKYGAYGFRNTSGDVLIITLPTTLGEGTYQVSSDGNYINAGFAYNKVNYSSVYAVYDDNYVKGASVGTITISKRTLTALAGTFNLTLYNEKGQKLPLTNGQFNLSYYK